MLLQIATRDTAPVFTSSRWNSMRVVYQTARRKNTNTQINVSFNKEAFLNIKQIKNNREEWLGKQLQLSVKCVLAEERSTGKLDNSLLQLAISPIILHVLNDCARYEA